MTTLVSSDASEYPFVSYLWSDGTEVTFNRQTKGWTSRQIPHPALNPSAFTRQSRYMTLAPDVGVDD